MPRDEEAQSGPGEFGDVVDVHLLDESLPLAARIARAPAHGSAKAMALVLAGGEPVVQIAETVPQGVDDWKRAAAGPLALTVERPLEHWTLSLDAPGARVTLDLSALTPPADLAEPATAAIGRAANLRRYAQLCRARGTAEVAGREHAIDAAAIRSHRWGPLGEAGRARFLTVASEDGVLLTVAAVRQGGGGGHGEELVGGFTTAPGTGADPAALPFETVRLSTVFDQDGLPVKLGAELFRPGDELPSRLAGVALGAVAGAIDGRRTSLTLFRLGLDGQPALGSYEIETGP